MARFVGPFVREARFRALIGSEAAEKGQFLFNGKVADLLYPKIDAVIANEPALAEIFAEWQAGMWPEKGRPDYAKADAARAELKDTKFPAELLGPDDARLEVGARVFETLWKAYSDPKKGFPDLTPYVNLAHFQALARYELIACKRTATLIAGRYVAGGGGGGTRSAGTAIKPTQLIGSVKTDMAEFGDDLALGTVATYSGELGKEVERMKRAIDDGWVIHARVLSGIEGGGKSRAETEHSIIVYGYSGNSFEYFDPDVGGSNVGQDGLRPPPLRREGQPPQHRGVRGRLRRLRPLQRRRARPHPRLPGERRPPLPGEQHRDAVRPSPARAGKGLVNAVR